MPVFIDVFARRGVMLWTAVLFGGAWLVQHGPALARRAL
jgi:hypothetical protein